MIKKHRFGILRRQVWRVVLLAAIMALPLEGAAAATNLVPNPSFEVHTACPTTLGQIALATSWDGFGPQDTPDYYHSCAVGASGVSIPANTFGTETPRTGQAYAGFIARPSNPAREYLRIPLTSALVAGVTYQVSFYVSLSDASQWAIDKVGAYLSVGPAPASNGYVLGVVPQIINPTGNVLSNKNGWTLVSGTYVALGGEDHLAIGNFADDASTTPVTGLGGFYPGSYYYVDDVSVEEAHTQGECATVESKEAVCKTDGSGGYTFTFTVTNNSGKDVDQILLTPKVAPGITLSQQVFPLTTPLHNGQATTLTVDIGNATPGTSACFFVTLMTKDGPCCTVEVCPVLPDCCATATGKFACDPKGNYTGTFSIVNTSPNTIKHIYLYPPAGVTMSQTYFAVTLAPGQTFTTPVITIQGAKPGRFCFRISMHTQDMKECCSVDVCIVLPECGIQSPYLFTVTNQNQLAAVDVTLLCGNVFCGTTIIGVTQDSGGGPIRRIRGLAYDPNTNRMYGMTREGQLVQVNLFTGATTWLYSLPSVPGAFWSGLAFDGTNKLYTANAFGSHELVEIVLGSPITSTVKGSTTLGGLAVQILGLEFYPASAPTTPLTFNGTHPHTGFLYGSNRSNDNIVVASTGNGAITMPFGNHAAGTNLQEIAFHPVSGRLYAIHDHFSGSQDAALSIYNFTTEVTNELGQLPFGVVEHVGGGNDTYGWGGLAFGPNSCVAPPNNMVAWYPFAEWPGVPPLNTTTETSLGNTGTLIPASPNGPIRMYGKKGSGLRFDGIDDYVQAPSTPAINFGAAGNNPLCTTGTCRGDFSIDAWIRLQPSAPNSVMVITDKRDPTTGVGYSFFLSSKRLGLTISDSSGTTDYTSIAQPLLTDGTWHHIAVTVARRVGSSTVTGQITWYFDGAPLAALGSNNPIAQVGSLANTSPLRIGTRTASTPLSDWLQGDLDEFEIFNRVLTPAEILGLFNAQWFGKC